MIGGLEEKFSGTQGGLSDMYTVAGRRVDVGRLGAAGREL
jgi:hypothetical protein